MIAAIKAFASPANMKAAAIIAVILFIFFSGFKASGYLWSAKYDRLEAAHAQAIIDQKERLLSRQERINEETEKREIDLLRELEIQREQYEELAANINTTPIIRERTIQCEEAPDSGGAVVAVVDWSVFGRLYDSGSTSRPAAEVDAASGRDATGEEGSPETR